MGQGRRNQKTVTEMLFVECGRGEEEGEGGSFTL